MIRVEEEQEIKVEERSGRERGSEGRRGQIDRERKIDILEKGREQREREKKK